jgi:predicted metal-binding membrane protein
LTTAIRTERALVAVLLGVAGLSWWWTIDRMRGMDNGPWTDLGAFGWFVGVWIVMMAAMMLPSVIPAVALYAGLARDRTTLAPLLFAAGYLAVWAAVGLFAFGLADAVSHLAGGALAWSRGGRWLAGTALLCAAAYQLTPLKEACLARCRAPLGLLLGSWRPGRLGGLRLGLASGAWCTGCCWALMASLFAVGVMSIVWTAVFAAVVALEKTLPWRRGATGGTAALLVVLGVLLLAAPGAIPGLTLPGGGGSMPMGG